MPVQTCVIRSLPSMFKPAMIKILLVIQQVVLYEDELADNGVSLLTVKVVNRQSLFVCCGLIFFLQQSEDGKDLYLTF